MIGKVRLKERTSKLDGYVFSATISRRADRWFVSLAVQRERDVIATRPVSRSSDVVGVDLGLSQAATIDDGVEARLIEAPKPLRESIERLRRLDRQLARRQNGSANYRKAKLRRARLHYRISNQRRDFLHKLSSDLAKAKPVIVLEDLHVKAMQRNRRLALSISDAGFGELRRQLAYKCDWYGSRLLVVDRFHPSTPTCSACGVLNDELRGFEGLRKRRFTCESCGLSLDRDENAARNLRSWGLNALASELPEGLRKVTPVSSVTRDAGGEPLGLAGEEGSGLPQMRQVKPASVKQEAKARRAPRRDPQMHEKTRAGVAWK